MAEIALLSDFGSMVTYITYTFSNSLLYPIMILLILLVIVSLILVGEFITEYTHRNRDQRQLENGTHEIADLMSSSSSSKESKNKEAASILRSMEGKQTQLVGAFAKDIAVSVEENNFKHIEKIADNYEVKMLKRTEKTRIITTVGPILGLMSTLIPLSPALIGLTSGNIEALATNLVIAFATTVIGLFVSGISFCLTTVRNRWYWQDLVDMDYILAALEAK